LLLQDSQLRLCFNLRRAARKSRSTFRKLPVISLRHTKITNPRNIAIWLSGYYNGKRDNTIIDMQELMEDTQKLQDYCILHPETPVMQAVEVLFVK